MALPNVHINPTVPTPVDRMLVCMCSMATCFQNAQYEKKLSCYAYLFIINEMVHKIPLPTLHMFLN